MKWAGHNDNGLLNIAETKKQEGCRTRGRPQLSWEDCVKRDLSKAEGEKCGEKMPTTGSNGKNNISSTIAE